MPNFAYCSGQQLMQMNERKFLELDKEYGSLLYFEFCKMITGLDEEYLLDILCFR